MGTLETQLVDLMEQRRKKRDSIGFMTRQWRPKQSYRMEQPLTPQQLKEEVAKSLYIEAAIREEAASTGETERVLRTQLQQILDEMCLERKMYIIRALGMAFIKTALSMRVGVFVNERRILQLRSEMGANPVLFLPTHRSYADFCLMTYLCYHYDIHLPAVAAGRDFYHMAGMGRIMRDTCAFYIPRSLVGAPLRAAALRRYMRSLVTHNPAPLEFFIEGARSRSNKSLPPKYGLLSMALLPLFTREVPDVTIVPVSINYDRVVEQTLFAYEHLGVPKPKETTRGLLKTISFLNDDFGDIYVSMGEAFSARAFMGELRAGGEPAKQPLELQELNREQFTQVQKLAEHVIVKQQDSTVMGAYNLIAVALMMSLMRGVPLHRDQLHEEVEWIGTVLRELGAQLVPREQMSASAERVLSVHRASVRFDQQQRLRLVCPSTALHAHTPNTKGHRLESTTLQSAVPVIQLQLYVNPAASRLQPAAFLVAAVRRNPLSRRELCEAYEDLCSLHKNEFVYSAALRLEQMERTLKFCLEQDVIRHDPSTGFTLGGYERLRTLLDVMLSPSVDTLLAIIDVMKEHDICEQWQLYRLTQQYCERAGTHPYCLSMEAIKNLVAGLMAYGALTLDTVTSTGSDKKETHYTACAERLERAERVLRAAVAPSPRPSFIDNPVLLRETISRL